MKKAEQNIQELRTIPNSNMCINEIPEEKEKTPQKKYWKK